MTVDEMPERPYRLPKIHQDTARKIIKDNILHQYRYKKRCPKCDGVGISRITKKGLLIPCNKCVNLYRVMNQWQSYLDVHP